MDRVLRAEIVAEVKRATAEALEVYNERYLTADQLCDQFAMITKDWLKNHGERLPRTHLPGSNRWAYPQHKIARMVADGSINQI